MIKITHKILENAKPNSIIAKGVFVDNWYTNIWNTWVEIQWVAVRWVIPDFAIYMEYIYSNESPAHPNLWDWSEKQIADMWDKFPASMVQSLIDIDDETLNKYYRS